MNHRCLKTMVSGKWKHLRVDNSSLVISAFDSSNRSHLPTKPSRNRSQPSCSLQHEFSLLNTNIPHIDVEVLDPIKRNATLRITVNGLIIMLQVTFPIAYPDSQSPEFAYCQGTNIDIHLSDALMKVLKTSASQRTKNGRPCLEFCLRALVTAFKKVCCLAAFQTRFSYTISL